MSSKNADAFVGCFTVVALSVMFLGMCLFPFVGCDYQYSEGFRDGQIQKFSKKGLIWKTWEGELALPGFKRIEAGGSVWEFTVLNNDVATDIQALPVDCQVRVYYKQVLKRAIYNGCTPYEVWKYEILK